MSTATHNHVTHPAGDQSRYGSGHRRPRRGPDTGIFKRFDVLAAGLESLATKRASSAPPTPRGASLRPPPPPMPVRRTVITLDDIEEVSCVEDPTPTQRNPHASRP
jgi:hypothetical protein